MKRRSFLKTFVGLVPGVAVTGGIGYPSHPSIDRPEALPEGMVGKDFLILARELAKEKRTVVGLFHDPAFAGREIPSLRPEDLQKTWDARDDIWVVLLDKYQVRSHSILFKRYKYYVHPYQPVTRIDGRYFPSLQGTLDVAGCRLGLVANNSSHEPVPQVFTWQRVP